MGERLLIAECLLMAERFPIGGLLMGGVYR
jgi:hypothetical protein